MTRKEADDAGCTPHSIVHRRLREEKEGKKISKCVYKWKLSREEQVQYNKACRSVGYTESITKANLFLV